MVPTNDKTSLLSPQQPSSPQKRRRPTFSGGTAVTEGRASNIEPPSPMESRDHDLATQSLEFETVDAFGNIISRSNSVSDLVSSNHSVVRDLRGFPSIPSSSYANRRQSLVNTLPSSSTISAPHQNRTSVGSSIVKSTGSIESPFGSKLAVNSSFAEKWADRQVRNSTGGHYGSTVIDMTDDHLPLANATANDDDLIRGEESIDFDSKPSSRNSSNASSLKDVCFPLDPIDGIQGDRVWPDLQVLQEFYEEETARLKDVMLRETNEVNFKFNQNDDNASCCSAHGDVGFSDPIVTKVDVPPSHLLGNQKINETETMNGRLRPPKINPFDNRHKTNNAEFLRTIHYPPQIVHNNPEHFRFTYFKEDLDSTVHSPTISGLLQPGQTFGDLFSASQYAKKQQNSNTLLPHLGSIPHKLQSISSSTKLNNASTSNSIRETTTPDGKHTNRSEEPPHTQQPSTPSEQFSTTEASPFWLDVMNPTEEEMKILSKTFAIHPLTTEDIFLGETREKVELFKEYYFVCFRSFDIVQEKAKKKKVKSQESRSDSSSRNESSGFLSKLLCKRRQVNFKSDASIGDNVSQTSSFKRRAREIELEKFQRKSGDRHKPKNNELEPLNVYILVFRNAVITFHFAPTPHPVNVRRRARLLKEYLTVSADWIAYALIDDITDAFGPMIESIEDEVNSIEDAILAMNNSSDSDDSDSDDDYIGAVSTIARSRYSRRNSGFGFDDKRSLKSISSDSTRSTSSNEIEWKKKGDMLKRIGETRKKVMSLLRLLGSKADVIKGFSKRCNEQWEVAPRSEIGMYLGDIQDHIVTMVQSLNHYEKLLARSHSNYLAQINIDMTKVNNDMNDVLGKITILGTIVLPMNIITGLWGMNVIVPGQDEDGLRWFWSIVFGMCALAVTCYIYTKRIVGL